jgi:DNA-binding LacI/PurR family transcriptional regulator
MTNRVTIEQIARAADVSAPTVSKVLNGRADVAPATRARVQAVIVDLRYQKRPAKSTAVPSLVHLIFDELESPWALEIVRGAVAAADELGLTVALTSLSVGRERQSWLDHVTSRGTAGVILLLSQLSAHQKAELRSRGLPFAVVDPRGQPDPDVLTIGATNWSGGFAATSHLVELGHRRIGVIGGRPDLLCSRARMDGYKSALEAAGLASDDRLVRWGDFHVDGGFRQAMALLDSPEPPTGIFCANDLQALGTLEAARQHHLRVPTDLSLVGFDDLPLSKWTSPPLTTVHQPLADMAATAVQLVLAQGQGNPQAIRSVELATRLVVRESSVRLRS